ncbi:myotubularin-related protein 10-B-like [Uloborus diversus]|uniref:myotubularin-related protein 10-B-like n=1 Tax=Uloborus diversus TaxID=327109 RepID=UPI002409B284|nr:myotubularin-related protein 10-B-like [Uloborus diversus]
MTANWLKELKSRSNSVKTFKSYVDLNPDEKEEETNFKQVKNSSDLNDLKKKAEEYNVEHDPYPKPNLLPGEVIISEAENVLKFNTLSELNRGISGVLLCTNFKLSFLTAENFPSNLYQKNLLLGENDICLINIDAIYHVYNGRRKKLNGNNIGTNVEIIEVHCKDFRIYTFSFKFSPLRQRSVINTIIHHAFVPKIHLLFAFDYAEESSGPEENNSFLFTQPCHWESELERCKCPGWRVTQANEKFLLCDSLPESFVVPSILLDMNLNKTAPHFAAHRVPTWSWGCSSGASIVRMASLDPSISDSKQRDVMIDAISRASPRQLPVQIFNLDESCSSYKEIQSSFLKLKDLCMPSTPQEFWESDNNYLSKLDSTKWLHHVSSCLNIALEAAERIIKNNTTVIFCEHEGRDLSCVLSSLVQLIMDPVYRTTSGFELLIQKEWVALGHPFTERHHLISGYEAEEAPIFLLFLDCVWQLLQQCPTVFEFSETYLTTLWDSCHVSLFDTFLFSNHKTRADAILTLNSGNNFCLRSIWDWSKQFTRNDQRLFSNPLHMLRKYATISPSKSPSKAERPKSFSSIKETSLSQCRPLFVKNDNIEPIVWNEEEENLLCIDPFIKSLKFWHQCYLRWIPLAHLLGGGPPMLFLNNLKIANEIQILEKKIKSLTARIKLNKAPSRHRRVASDDYTISAEVIGATQMQEGSSVITSVFPFSPVAPWDWSSYQFVPSTSCLKISYTETEEILDE